jgi:hypothetical protein
MGRRLPSRAKIQHDYISRELTLAGDDNGSIWDESTRLNMEY